MHNQKATPLFLVPLAFLWTISAQAQVQTSANAASTADSSGGVGAENVVNAQDVIVTGIRAAFAHAVQKKRDGETITEVINAEDVGKMPDKNVADSLQHMTGVATSSASGGEGGFDENDRVSLRGTGPSLTQTLVNGHTISTGDWFSQASNVGRSASYALLPSELVGQVTVHKSATADQVEGGLAGAIDVETRRPLDFKKQWMVEASVEAVHSDLANKTDPQFSGLLNWKSSGNTLGILVQAFSQTRHLRRDGQEFLGYGLISSQQFPAIVSAHPDLEGVVYPRLIGMALFEQERKRNGGALEAQIKPSSDVTMGFSGFYSRLWASNFNSNYLVYPEAWLITGISPTSYNVRNGTLVAANFPAQSIYPAVYQDSIARPGANAESYYTDWYGKWHVSDRLKLSSEVGYTRGIGNTPTTSDFSSQASGAAVGYRMNGLASATALNFSGIDTANFAGTSISYFSQASFSSTDSEAYGRVDAEFIPGEGLIDSSKFGMRIANHDRRTDFPYSAGPTDFNNLPALPAWNGTTYPADFGSTFGVAGPRYWVLDQAEVEDWVNRNVTPDPTTQRNWPAEFDVRENDVAAYGMANVSGMRWHADFGLRVVRTKQRIAVNVAGGAHPIEGLNAGPYTPTLVAHDFTDALPSANLKFDLARDWVLRAALSRTMARPDYSALGNTVSLDDILNLGYGGNPNLKPIRSNNADLSAEWYFAPKAVLSLGVFYMDMPTYVGFGASSADYYNQRRQRIESYQVTSPINVRATNRGIELGYQQPVGRHFGVLANTTYAKGSEEGSPELVGASRNVYNAGAYYEDDRLGLRLEYNHRSDYLVGLDRSFAQHEAGVGTLSASLNYRLNDQISFTCQALNLNNPVLKYYGNNADQPRAFYSNGRQVYVGLRAKI